MATDSENRNDKVCVLGAGTSGLAMARHLSAARIPFDCLEREDDLGGNWNLRLACSSVCESTHLISSKKLTEYPDHPMPDDWPEYPSQRRVLEYVRGYADRFGLRRHIEFGTGVRHVQRAGVTGWLVTLESGAQRRYGKLVIANGHNWDPNRPTYPGTFDGLTLHSGDYKKPNLLAGKRVLVIGGGNSGCDIAVESADHAASTTLSLRRGYHFMPKFFHGTPIDICGERLLWARVPLWARRALARLMVFFLMGTRHGTGLPKPDHRLFETHPTINSQLHYKLRHGDLTVRPDVEQLCGPQVRFTDGTQEAFDVILYATGYRLTFPFIDKDLLNWDNGRPDLYLNIFHPEQDDLFVLGMIQPDSGQWGLVDRQARLVVRSLLGTEQGTRPAAQFHKRKRSGSAAQAIRYLDSPRHRLEVEHYGYRRLLDRELRRLR